MQKRREMSCNFDAQQQHTIGIRWNDKCKESIAHKVKNCAKFCGKILYRRERSARVFLLMSLALFLANFNFDAMMEHRNSRVAPKKKTTQTSSTRQLCFPGNLSDGEQEEHSDDDFVDVLLLLHASKVKFCIESKKSICNITQQHSTNENLIKRLSVLCFFSWLEQMKQSQTGGRVL